MAVVLLVALGGCTSDGGTAETDALVAARLAAANIGQLVTGGAQLLKGLAQVPYITESNRAECDALAATIVKQYDGVYASMARIDAEGVVDCSATPSTDRVTVNDRLYYKRVLETKNFSVGEYQIGRITKKRSIVFAQPVLENGNVAKTLIVTVDLEVVGKRLADFPLPEAATMTLIDAGGKVLATTLGEEWLGKRLPGSFKLTAERDAREGTIGQLEDLDGEERHFSFRVVDGLPQGQNLYVLVGVTS